MKTCNQFWSRKKPHKIISNLRNRVALLKWLPVGWMIFYVISSFSFCLSGQEMGGEYFWLQLWRANILILVPSLPLWAVRILSSSCLHRKCNFSFPQKVLCNSVFFVFAPCRVRLGALRGSRCTSIQQEDGIQISSRWLTGLFLFPWLPTWGRQQDHLSRWRQASLEQHITTMYR